LALLNIGSDPTAALVPVSKVGLCKQWNSTLTAAIID